MMEEIRNPLLFRLNFHVLLAQGAEGIAVGLSTKILPHNFNEILDAMIDALRKNPINLLPDFPQGGIADCTDYNGGARGASTSKGSYRKSKEALT